MKKVILFCFMAVFTCTAHSQEFRVESIVELTQDLSARTSPRVDKSGTECAIIRINIPSIRDVYFSSPIVGDPIFAPGEYTVYVPADSKKIDLTCDGTPLSIVFSSFQITLQPKSCYRVVVKKSGNNVGAEGYARVKVTANYEDDILLIDGVPVGQLPLYVDDISVGVHTFSIPNVNGRTMDDTSITIKRGLNEINLRIELKEPQLMRINMIFYGGEMHDLSDDEIIWGGGKVDTGDYHYGLVDECGNEIIPIQYWSIGDRYNNSRVLYRVYNPLGQDCKTISGFGAGRGLFKLGEGEIIPPNDTIIGITILNEDSVIIQSCSKKYWLFSLSTKRQEAYVPHVLAGNYMAECERDWDNKNYSLKITNAQKEVVLNVKGINEFFFDPQYDIVAVAKCIRTWQFDTCDYRIYDLTTGNEIVIPSKYRFVNLWYGLIAVEDRTIVPNSRTTSKIGLLDRNNNIVIPINYKGTSNCGLGGYSQRLQRIFEDFICHNEYHDYDYSYPGDIFEAQPHGTLVLERYIGDTIESSKEELGGHTFYHHKIHYDTDVYNTSGKIIAHTGPGVPQQNRFQKKLTNGSIVCKNPNGKLGILDSVGNVILPFIYDSIIDYLSMAYAIKEDGTGIGINIRGEIMLPAGKYKEILTDGFCSKIHALTRNNFQMYNNNGKRIAQFPVSTDAHFINYGSKSDKFGGWYKHFAIKSGNTIIRRTEDDRLYQVVNTKTGKYGFISNNGELVANCIYDELSDIIDVGPGEELYDKHKMSINMFSACEGFGILRIGNRFGFIDTQGTVVVPMIYTRVTPFVNGVSVVRDANNNCTKIYSKDLK